MDDRQKGCALGCGVLAALFFILMMGATAYMRRLLLKPPPPPPGVAPNLALRPRYILQDGRTIEMGYAVAVRLHAGGDPVLLAPMDVFGPDSKVLQKYTAPSALKELVREVELRPVGGTEVIARARNPLLTTGFARAEKDPNVDTDLAAFALDEGGKADVMDLAEENPRLRSWVWLVADLPRHQPQVERPVPARVTGDEDRGVWLKIEEKFPMTDADGVPVLNGDGQVAGVVFGGDPGRAKMLPAGAIRRILAKSGLQ